jgi:hypothetical protein
VGLLRIGRQVQVGEEDLAFAQALALDACGSLTFTIMSALAKTSSAVSMILAPAAT